MVDDLDKIDELKKEAKKTDPKISIESDDSVFYGMAFGFQTTGYTAVELAYNFTRYDVTSKMAALSNMK